jgi:hypothetical protein
MPTLLTLRRPTSAARRLRRPALAGLLLAAALALTGCTQVAIIRSAPLAAGSFDAKLGNDPLAAADARSLQKALGARSQVWGIRLVTQPASAGYVTVSDLNQLVAARGKVTSFDLVLTATAPATLQGFSSQGTRGEQAYLESLAQAIAGAGYTKVTAVQIDVWYQSSHHGVLSWRAGKGFAYKILDGKQ